MENATKALLIAASILIVIVLIAVGIKILSSTQGVTNEVDKVSEAMGKSVFNSQFTDYVGSQSSAEVKALLSKAAATYRSEDAHKVSITTIAKTGNGLNSATCSSADTIGGIMSNLKVGYIYKVSIVSYDSNGYINSVSIQ